jgi:hypothetical protein
MDENQIRREYMELETMHSLERMDEQVACEHWIERSLRYGRTLH